MALASCDVEFTVAAIEGVADLAGTLPEGHHPDDGPSKTAADEKKATSLRSRSPRIVFLYGKCKNGIVTIQLSSNPAVLTAFAIGSAHVMRLSEPLDAFTLDRECTVAMQGHVIENDKATGLLVSFGGQLARLYGCDTPPFSKGDFVRVLLR
jgi:hypothetical protein